MHKSEGYQGYQFSFYTNLLFAPTLYHLIPPQDAANSEVKIACGTCVSLDKTDGSLIELPHGLNVVGKLHIPNIASFTLRTKYVLVQGVFRVDPPPLGSTLPRAAGEKVTFQLMGDESISFLPDMETDNGMACGMESDMVTRKACNVGIKPFAIAGGTYSKVILVYIWKSVCTLIPLNLTLFNIKCTFSCFRTSRYQRHRRHMPLLEQTQVFKC